MNTRYKNIKYVSLFMTIGALGATFLIGAFMGAWTLAAIAASGVVLCLAIVLILALKAARTSLGQTRALGRRVESLAVELNAVGLGQKVATQLISKSALRNEELHASLRDNDMGNVGRIEESLEALDTRVRRLTNVYRSDVAGLQGEVARITSDNRDLADSIKGIDSVVSLLERRLVNKLRVNPEITLIRSRIERFERRVMGLIENFRFEGLGRLDTIDGEMRASVETGIDLLANIHKLHSDLEEVSRDLQLNLIGVDSTIVEQSALIVANTQNFISLKESVDTLAVENRTILEDAFEAHFRQLRQRIGRHVTEVVRDSTRQTEALIQVLPRFADVDVLLPPTGGFAMDAPSMLHLISLLEERKPKLILELGGGTSTVWMGHICRQFGTKIISLDHLPSYLQSTREAVTRNGLEDVVECRLAELESVTIDGEAFDWYSAEAFRDLSGVDFLLIDGPPEATGPSARFPALHALSHILTPDATVVLDDTHRDTELQILKAWEIAFANFVIIDKGVSRLGVLVQRG